MNDTAAQATEPLTKSLGTPPRALLQRALIVALVLFAADQALFPFGYAVHLVSGPGEYVRFAALCLALATVSALPLALFMVAFHALSAQLGRMSRLDSAAPGRTLQVIALFTLGALIAMCQDGRFLRIAPTWASALFLLPAVFAVPATRAVAARVSGAKYNAAAACSLLLLAWYFAHYEVLDRFQNGRYGFAYVARLRTLVDLAAATGLVLASALAVLPLASGPSRAARIALAAAAASALLALQWMNTHFFVDLHLPLHTCLTMACALVAWRASELLQRRVEPGTPTTRDRWLTAAAPMLGLGVTLALAPGSNAAYLAAQHTAFARFGMELVFEHGAQLDARTGEVLGVMARAARVLRHKPLPPSTRPLPSTLARPTLDPAARADARGAVIFFLDMKRFRDIGPGPDGRTRTPRIDRCFDGGFRFQRALSSSTRTISVLPSIYTSTYAGTRGQTRPDLAVTPAWFAYQNGHHNLVDTLGAAGFRTLALTNQYYLRYLRNDAERPLFGTFDVVLEADETDGVNPGLLALLASHPSIVPLSGRFLLVVHIMSHPLEHLPGVDAVVDAVCTALQRAGRMSDTVLMLTADHGVQFDEHGRETYGRTLFQEELHVPLLWKIPGMVGRDVGDAVSVIDHFPTLLDLFQLQVPFALEGRSYARTFRGEPLDHDRPIFFEVRRYEVPAVGVFLRGRKLIRWPRTGTRALFSLAEDPGETRNLVDDPAHQGELEQLEHLLARFVRERH